MQEKTRHFFANVYLQRLKFAIEYHDVEKNNVITTDVYPEERDKLVVINISINHILALRGDGHD